MAENILRKLLGLVFLSTSWKNLWLDSSVFLDYNAFASFMDRLLGFSLEEKSCLNKVKLSIHKDENDQSCVTHLIDLWATRKLEHLNV